jgi:hypothetical protein
MGSLLMATVPRDLQISLVVSELTRWVIFSGLENFFVVGGSHRDLLLDVGSPKRRAVLQSLVKQNTWLAPQVMF